MLATRDCRFQFSAHPNDHNVAADIDGKFVHTNNNYGWSDTALKQFVEEVKKFYHDTKFALSGSVCGITYIRR